MTFQTGKFTCVNIFIFILDIYDNLEGENSKLFYILLANYLRILGLYILFYSKLLLRLYKI